MFTPAATIRRGDPLVLADVAETAFRSLAPALIPTVPSRPAAMRPELLLNVSLPLAWRSTSTWTPGGEIVLRGSRSPEISMGSASSTRQYVPRAACSAAI
jgi:hypothetical protein